MSDLAIDDRVERPRAAAGSAWPRASIAALAFGIILLCGLFLPEFSAAVEVWNASTAYGHCYLILPMTLYLLWDRRAVLAANAPDAQVGWAVLGLPIAAVWLAAERLGIMEGRQLAAIAGFELLFLVVLGWRLFWSVSGPLLFLIFLVPFGAFVTPALQRFTADFTILGLNLLGVPNYSDQFTIETPAGTFLVAEACAGLRFLIAAVAFGVFYALLSFRSPARRIIYIAISIAVPIVANGFRAFGIVMLGQILGSAEAAAADHLIYGWVFFTFVMLLLVAAGQPFREAPMRRGEMVVPHGRRASGGQALGGAVAAVLLVAVGPGIAWAIDRSAALHPLAGGVDWRSPAGCGEAVRTGSKTAEIDAFSVACPSGRYDVEVRTYPARATSRALMVDRRRHTQELSAEDTSVSGVPGADGWTLVQTTEPDGVSAFATWVDGMPAGGGLSGRLAQARDSVLGSAYQPVLITVSAAAPGRASSPVRREAIEQIRALVAAQDRLGERIARISRIGG